LTFDGWKMPIPSKIAPFQGYTRCQFQGLASWGDVDGLKFINIAMPERMI